MNRSKPSHVVILGLMGAGKTTLGRALSQRLGWPLNDSDQQIERATGRTVRQLKDELGVDEMHELESAQLLAALDEQDPSVIDAAASVVDDPRCRRALRRRGVVAIWLRGSAETLAARFGSSSHRPAYGRDPIVFLRAQIARRGPLFAAIRPRIVEIDGKAPAQVLAEVLGHLRASGLRPR